MVSWEMSLKVDANDQGIHQNMSAVHAFDEGVFGNFIQVKGVSYLLFIVFAQACDEPLYKFRQDTEVVGSLE
jgi:hypothetical protein